MKSLLIAILLPTTPVTIDNSKGNVEKGHEKSVTCQSCHGAKGVSNNDAVPNLCGQKFKYMEAQMTAYKDGSRKNPVMEAVTKSLSDEDITDILAYYTAQKGCN